MFDKVRNRMDGSRRRPRGPKLDRRNAVKHIDYDAADAASASWTSSSTAPVVDLSPGTTSGLRASRSLDLSPAEQYSDKTSFRIGGSIEGEIDLLCRSLGLSGPEDFAIPAAAWEARKARSSSSLLPPSRLLGSPSSSPAPRDPAPPIPDPHPPLPDLSRLDVEDRPPASARGGSVGIRGARPPLLSPPTPAALAPPPSRSFLVPPPPMPLSVLDRTSSAWDIVRSFAPEDDGELGGRQSRLFESNAEAEEEVAGAAAEGEEVMIGEMVENLTGSSSFTTSNDDDSSSTTTEPATVISPNGKIRRIIPGSWEKGGLLGSGSFGTVYEGISDEGNFFAVKEVSLLDQGTNAKQCIFQLEQEIALLSTFEHENIVQYYGTDKEEAKLFIFLELVTQGSLASLYQRYHLRDSQVSAYTRQILNGLKYLHDRNVVHRDIKCTNILVHATGSVKLADFGLAKEITKFNLLKSCKGSVYWMAPEVVNPKKTYGASADIWSLGCTVLEMLTRQVPYPDLEWPQALFRIGRGEKPVIPNSLSRDARHFIGQCVQVNPDDRPTAAQLLEHPFVRRSLSSEFNDASLHDNGRWS